MYNEVCIHLHAKNLLQSELLRGLSLNIFVEITNLREKESVSEGRVGFGTREINSRKLVHGAGGRDACSSRSPFAASLARPLFSAASLASCSSARASCVACEMEQK